MFQMFPQFFTTITWAIIKAIGIDEGFELTDGRFRAYGITQFYFLSRFTTYVVVFTVVWIPLILSMLAVWFFYWKDPESPILSRVYWRLRIWAFWSYLLRVFQVGWLDLLLSVGLQIRTYHKGKHVWNRYMEYSYISTYFFILAIPIWLIVICVVFNKANVRKSGLPLSINGASKGLN